MGRTRETGRAALSTIIFFLLLAGVGYAAWHNVPVVYDHYDLVDKVNEICRTPKYVVRSKGEEYLLDQLMKEVDLHDMEEWIGKNNFEITSTDNNRKIRLYYEREAKVLPGYKHKWVWDFTADQPLLN
jgi:hypothetical protein